MAIGRFITDYLATAHTLKAEVEGEQASKQSDNKYVKFILDRDSGICSVGSND